MKPHTIKYCCLECEHVFKDNHYNRKDYFEALPCVKCGKLAVDRWKFNKYRTKLQSKDYKNGLKVKIRFDIQDTDIERIKKIIKDVLLDSVQVVTTSDNNDEDLPTRFEGSE